MHEATGRQTAAGRMQSNVAVRDVPEQAAGDRKTGRRQFRNGECLPAHPSLHRRINPPTHCDPAVHASRSRVESVGG